MVWWESFIQGMPKENNVLNKNSVLNNNRSNIYRSDLNDNLEFLIILFSEDEVKDHRFMHRFCIL